MMNVMNGEELARAYWQDFGEPMLRERFPDQADRIACGLVGEGSECFGFDDETSQDHDFGVGFSLWLTDEDERAIGGELRRCYGDLPALYRGYHKKVCQIGGIQRCGVQRSSDFYRHLIGRADTPRTLKDWRPIPESALALATNGWVFSDPLGQFSRIRTGLLAYYPEDLRKKKLAARIGAMARAGQYNYPRMIARGERVAALLALAQFIEAACAAVYLLNRRYMPFFKWAHRGLRELPLLSEVALLLDALARRPEEDQASDLIEAVCLLVRDQLRQQGLIQTKESFLMVAAVELQVSIQDETLRAEDVFAL